MPDGELVVEREVVPVLLSVTASGLLEMSSGSWMVESAMCSVLLIRDLSCDVPMNRDLINNH